MLQTRVIPVLLLRNNELVKTTQFKKDKYVGDPINAIKIFNDKEVDELIVLDIDASKNNTEPNYELIESFASECFMPICYGGGVKTLEQMKKIFRLGIEKISINTGNLESYDLVKEAIETFGAQSIVLSIDIKKSLFGSYYIYNHAKKRKAKQTLDQYLDDIDKLGVGELFINSVDNDGMQKGYDLQLIKKVESKVSMPLVVCGGASSLDDFKTVKDNCKVSGLAAGSFFVFHGPFNAVLISYPKYQDLRTLFGE